MKKEENMKCDCGNEMVERILLGVIGANPFQRDYFWWCKCGDVKQGKTETIDQYYDEETDKDAIKEIQCPANQDTKPNS